MIEVKNISLALNKRQILNNVSLTLKEGNIYGLVGNNGSGKTMLMKCMCGFIRPTEGTVESNGKVIGRDVDYLPDAGVIIETPGFIPYYSGFQNLKVLAGIKNKISAKEIREAIQTVGLDPDLKLPVKKYSLECGRDWDWRGNHGKSVGIDPGTSQWNGLVRTGWKKFESCCYS